MKNKVVVTSESIDKKFTEYKIVVMDLKKNKSEVPDLKAHYNVIKIAYQIIRDLIILQNENLIT